MFLKKIMIATMVSAFLMGTLPVDAATFGKSSGSSSRSSSSSFSSGSSNRSSSSFGSSPSRSATTSSSGGISQGTSVGMSRSSVANDVKSGNYTAPANGTTVAGSNPGGNSSVNRAGGTTGATGGTYNNGGYNNGGVPTTPGHSTGTVVGAAAVGALAGYALSNHNGNNGGYNNGGGNGYNNGNGNGYNNNNGGMVDNNGNYVNSQSSGGGIASFIWTLIKIIVGLVILYFIVRFVMGLFNNGNTSSGSSVASVGGGSVSNRKTPEDEIRDQKESFFVDFQQNNRPSGLDHIRQNSTSVFFNAVEDMVRDQSETRTVKVRQLEAELVDLTQEGSRYIASVRYNAVVSEGESGSMQDTNLKEMWNFVYENNHWKIAGIDQL